MHRHQIQQLTKAGVLAALIFITTCLFHLPVGINGGYIHFGDTLVYLAAAMLPTPYAMAASAIGAGLSDLLSPGGVLWVLPTLVIKPLCCLAFSSRRQRLLCRQNILALFIAAILTIGGYFLSGWIIGGLGAAIAELSLSWIQSVGSAVGFVCCAIVLDRMHIKQGFSANTGGMQK